ncbi:hypothetical protein Sjap_026152 [Stephania japonica]|uniref:Phospholipase A1 n=1 Tax=Stephania japonica TaxID=461633 RepID=A0AAP0HIL9_9MAGN
MANVSTEKADPSWPKLLGSQNWDSLLNPLDLNLREFILLCGDLCQATYDSFNGDQDSKYCGSCRYGKASLFDKVGFPLASSTLFVDTFLYATSQVDLPLLVHSNADETWDRESNWMGYIAVSKDENAKASGRREIYVMWRGTIRPLEWVNVLDAEQQPILPTLARHNNRTDDDNIRVMKGWLTVYISSNQDSPFTKLSARDQLLTKIKELVNRYKGENLSIIFTGHSLGASLAVLSSFDVVRQLDELSAIPVCAIVFGCPQVGNNAFAKELEKLKNLKILHTRNVIDLIPHYPSHLLGYVDTGMELIIDTRKSPSLKDSSNPSDWHNLQAMLHVVAGWNGEGVEFALKVKRSLALVNKSCDFLKEEFHVPGSWWVEKNKGMVLDEDGDWVLAPPFEEDMPVPEF